jgi:hypothetical protein
MPVLREISRVWVSEGGLEPPSWWYIPESGIHHQSKLTQQGPSGTALRTRAAAASPGRMDVSECLTCGNVGCGQPGWNCEPGLDCSIRTAALLHPAGMATTASRCCPEVPAPQPPRTSPDDLAAELNPHKTELNPHKAVPGCRPRQNRSSGASRAQSQSPPVWQPTRVEPSRRLRSAVAMTLRYRRRPSGERRNAKGLRSPSPSAPGTTYVQAELWCVLSRPVVRK